MSVTRFAKRNVAIVVVVTVVVVTVVVVTVVVVTVIVVTVDSIVKGYVKNCRFILLAHVFMPSGSPLLSGVNAMRFITKRFGARGAYSIEEST